MYQETDRMTYLVLGKLRGMTTEIAVASCETGEAAVSLAARAHAHHTKRVDALRDCRTPEDLDRAVRDWQENHPITSAPVPLDLFEYFVAGAVPLYVEQEG